MFVFLTVLFTCLFVCLFVCLFLLPFFACLSFGNVGWIILDERVYQAIKFVTIWQLLRILSHLKKILLIN